MAKTSRLPGFHRLSPAERLARIRDLTGLAEEDTNALAAGLPLDVASRMAENVIGTMGVPLGIATNFTVNGRDVLVPMAIEEASVVAAASHAAKLARPHGGFHVDVDASIMVGQIPLVDVADRAALEAAVMGDAKSLLSMVNDPESTIVKRGGGAKRLSVRHIETAAGPMSVVDVEVDVVDAMGANAVNTICEDLAPALAERTGAKPLMKILTNLADRRVARARAVFDGPGLGGRDVVDGIVAAWAFADADPYRATTHNKGIMNGVSAVVLATGNDTRAVEAGAHAYAARTGRYRSLSTFRTTEDGHLEGELEVPLAVGTVGGATKVNPAAAAALKVLGVGGARELAAIIAAVGLAQNTAALRALVAEGIQEGHMRLHARNLAAAAGATGTLIDRVAERLAEGDDVSLRRARELVEELSGS